MPNPIKSIKGGLQGVKNAATAVKINNQIAKSPTGSLAGGNARTKMTLGPANVAKAFVNGAKNPQASKVSAQQLKTVKQGLKNP
jgi:hypothetical protein